MENILKSYGFKKDGIYTWYNDPYHIMIYYDGVTISKNNEDDNEVLFEGILPSTSTEKEKLIESKTGLKKLNISVVNLLNSTKAERIYTSTSLYLSNCLINYIKYNNTSEDDLCNKLGINYDKLGKILSGSYNFTLSEISKISVLINKTIIIK